MLEELMGPSWRSTTLGVLSITMGLVLFLVGWATDEGTLKITGLGLIPTGILGLVTRDNAASTAAHQESLDQISEAKVNQQRGHVQNARKIDELTTQIAEVPVVAAQTAQVVAAQTAVTVVDEKLK